jgi:transposase
MLWTQNAWAHGDNRAAAYQCPNGHVLDPALTHQCPRCGVHDTGSGGSKADGAFECHRCGNTFTVAS